MIGFTSNNALGAILYRSIINLRRNTKLITDGVNVLVDNHHVNIFGGGGIYKKIPKVVGQVDNGGTLIIADNGDVFELQHNGTVSLKQFGAKGDGVEGDQNIGDDSVAYTNWIQWGDQNDANILLLTKGIYNLKQTELSVINNLIIKGQGDDCILTNGMPINYEKSFEISNFKLSFFQNTTISPHKYQTFLENREASSAQGSNSYKINYITTYLIDKLVYQKCADELDMPTATLEIVSNEFEKMATGLVQIEALFTKGKIHDNSIHDIYNLDNALKDITDPSYSNCGTNFINNPETDTSYAWTGFKIGKQGLTGISRSEKITVTNNTFDKVLVGLDWTNTEPEGESSVYCALIYGNNCTAKDNKFIDCQRSLYLRGGGNEVDNNKWYNWTVYALSTIVWKSTGTDQVHDPFKITNNKFLGRIYSGLIFRPSSNIVIKDNEYDIINEDIQVKEFGTGNIVSYNRDKFINFTELPDAAFRQFIFKDNDVNIRSMVKLNFLELFNAGTTPVNYIIKDNTLLGIHSTANYYSINISNTSAPNSQVLITDNEFSGMFYNVKRTDVLIFGNNTQIRKDGLENPVVRGAFRTDVVEKLIFKDNKIWWGSNSIIDLDRTRNIELIDNKLFSSYPVRIDNYTGYTDVYLKVEGNEVPNSMIHFTESSKPVGLNVNLDVLNNKFNSLFTFSNANQALEGMITINKFKNNSSNSLYTYISSRPDNLKIFNSFSYQDRNKKVIKAIDLLDINSNSLILNKPTTSLTDTDLFNSSFFIFIKSIKYNYYKGSVAYTGDTQIIIKEEAGVDLATIDIVAGSQSGQIEVNQALSFEKNLITTTANANPLNGTGRLEIEVEYDFHFINDNTNLPTIN